MPSLVEIGPIVLEKNLKNVKSLQTDGQTDKCHYRFQIGTYLYGSGQLKIYIILKTCIFTSDS